MAKETGKLGILLALGKKHPDLEPRPKPPSKGEAMVGYHKDGVPADLHHVAQELIDAVKSGNAQEVADALYAAHCYIDAEEYREEAEEAEESAEQHSRGGDGDEQEEEPEED